MKQGDNVVKGAPRNNPSARFRKSGNQARVAKRALGLFLGAPWRTAPRDITPGAAVWYDPSTGWKGDG